MGAGEGIQTKCQNNNLAHLRDLFFCCATRKKQPLEHAPGVRCAYLSDRGRGGAWSVGWTPILCWSELERDFGSKQSLMGWKGKQ